MRKKTIGIILICMLFIPNIIVTAEQLVNNEKSKDQIKIINTTLEKDDEVPVWEVGDRWTFQINDFWSDHTFQGKSITMDGEIDEFKWTVTDVSNTYTVAISGEIEANYEIIVPVGNSDLNLKGTFEPPINKLEGTIIFDKENLQIVDFDGKLTCLTKVKVNNMNMKIPMLFKISIDASLSAPFPMLKFPLHTFKLWNLPEMDIEADVSIKGILGVAEIPMTFYTHYDWIPLAFTCFSQENIEVDAGTFDAWKIQSLLGGFFEYYYAPAAENIVKFEINMPHGGIEGELKSYEHSYSQKSFGSSYLSRLKLLQRSNI